MLDGALENTNLSGQKRHQPPGRQPESGSLRGILWRKSLVKVEARALGDSWSTNKIRCTASTIVSDIQVPRLVFVPRFMVVLVAILDAMMSSCVCDQSSIV